MKLETSKPLIYKGLFLLKNGKFERWFKKTGKVKIGLHDYQIEFVEMDSEILLGCVGRYIPFKKEKEKLILTNGSYSLIKMQLRQTN